MNRETFEKIVRAKLAERGVTNVDAKEIESAVKRANDVHVQMSERLQQDLTRLFDLSVQGVPFSKILEITGADQDSLIIDLGANLGQQLGEIVKIGAEVHAFEPHPILGDFLEKKYEEHPNVIVKKSAAGVVNGEVRFFYKGTEEEINGGASLLVWKMYGDLDQVAGTRVACSDIAEYITNLDRQVKILKIDIEGFEYEVLNHLLSTDAIKKV